MATKLFLRATTVQVAGYSDLDGAAGSSITSAVVTLTSGGTNIQWTATEGGTAMAWITKPFAAGFTLTSVDVSVWQRESNGNDEAKGRFQLYKYSGGAEGSALDAAGYDDATEMKGNGMQEDTWTGNCADTAFSAGDRLVVKFFAANFTTMTAGTATLQYNAADAATGDSFITLAETVTFNSPSASPSSSISSS